MPYVPPDCWLTPAAARAREGKLEPQGLNPILCPPGPIAADGSALGCSTDRGIHDSHHDKHKSNPVTAARVKALLTAALVNARMNCQKNLRSDRLGHSLPQAASRANPPPLLPPAGAAPSKDTGAPT